MQVEFARVENRVPSYVDYYVVCAPPVYVCMALLLFATTLLCALHSNSLCSSRLGLFTKVTFPLGCRSLPRCALPQSVLPTALPSMRSLSNLLRSQALCCVCSSRVVLRSALSLSPYVLLVPSRTFPLTLPHRR
jgi:hypothetical protein